MGSNPAQTTPNRSPAFKSGLGTGLEGKFPSCCPFTQPPHPKAMSPNAPNLCWEVQGGPACNGHMLPAPRGWAAHSLPTMLYDVMACWQGPGHTDSVLSLCSLDAGNRGTVLNCA
jgi:hypothetical protein